MSIFHYCVLTVATIPKIRTKEIMDMKMKSPLPVYTLNTILCMESQ